LSIPKKENEMLIIDRFEENFAVVEDGEKIININRALIPKNAKEGDVLIFYNNAYIIDETATKARREMILGKMRKVGL